MKETPLRSNSMLQMWSWPFKFQVYKIRSCVRVAGTRLFGNKSCEKHQFTTIFKKKIIPHHLQRSECCACVLMSLLIDRTRLKLQFIVTSSLIYLVRLLTFTEHVAEYIHSQLSLSLSFSLCVSRLVVLYLAMMAAALVARRSLMQLQRLFRRNKMAAKNDHAL